MLDRPVRRVLQPVLGAIVAPLARSGVRPNHLTLLALLLALAAAIAAGRQSWVLAVVLWLASRVVDGLDGELARTSLSSSPHDADLGGFLDIMGDFTAYAAVPIGVAVGVPDARLAVAVLVGTYYVNGSAFLAFSSIAERRGIRTDERAFQFLGGLAEGTETIAVHTAMLLWPSSATTIAWAFAVVVGLTAIERVVVTARIIRADGVDQPT